MKVKSPKGITLISLVITIIILLILTSTVISKINVEDNFDAYQKMCVDIEVLEDKILMYYNDYKEIPIQGEVITSELPSAITESGSYYQIDVTKLKNITLNYNPNEYIINATTHKVYYISGIEYDGETFYTY